MKALLERRWPDLASSPKARSRAGHQATCVLPVGSGCEAAYPGQTWPAVARLPGGGGCDGQKKSNVAQVTYFFVLHI